MPGFDFRAEHQQYLVLPWPGPDLGHWSLFFFFFFYFSLFPARDAALLSPPSRFPSLSGRTHILTPPPLRPFVLVRSLGRLDD